LVRGVEFFRGDYSPYGVARQTPEYWKSTKMAYKVSIPPFLFDLHNPVTYITM